MLDLIICEFQKLKRKKFLLFATLAAVVLPIPMTMFAIRQGWSYDQLFMIILEFGHFLMLVPVVCIVATMLFFMERDSSTLKNIIPIPLSRRKIVYAKLAVLAVVSIGYSLVAVLSSFIGAAVIGQTINYASERIILSVIAGLMTMLASIPCIALIIWCNKNYIISLIFTFFYAILGFMVSMDSGTSSAAPGMNVSTLLPVGMISRWLLPKFAGFVQAGSIHLDQKYISTYAVSTPMCLGYLFVIGAIFTFLIVKAYKRQEI